MKPKTVAIIGPPKLGDAFTVLLNSVPGMSLLVYTPDFNGLRSAVVEDPPDIVLSFVGAAAAEGWLHCERAGEIKKLWPQTSFIALITDAQIREKVRALGADAVFFEGIQPQRLLQAIEVLEK